MDERSRYELVLIQCLCGTLLNWDIPNNGTQMTKEIVTMSLFGIMKAVCRLCWNNEITKREFLSYEDFSDADKEQIIRNYCEFCGVSFDEMFGEHTETNKQTDILGELLNKALEEAKPSE